MGDLIYISDRGWTREATPELDEELARIQQATAQMWVRYAELWCDVMQAQAEIAEEYLREMGERRIGND